MGILAKVFGSAGGALVDKVAGVVDELTLSKEEKQRFNIEMQRLILDQFTAVQASVQARFEAVKGIIQAEMASGDSFTKRARPTVVYFGLILYGLQVLSQFFPSLPPVSIPTDFTVAWASVVGIWSVGRSVEKVRGPGGMSAHITGARSPALDKLEEF